LLLKGSGRMLNSTPYGNSESHAKKPGKLLGEIFALSLIGFGTKSEPSHRTSSGFKGTLSLLCFSNGD
jgi:hypothetical protein